MNYGPYMGMPYYSMIPAATKGGLFSRLLGGINFSSIITNTQKTLGFVNQAIPVIKQVQPVIKNAKTMFKVMNEFKRTDTTTSINKGELSSSNSEINTDNSTTSNISTSNDGPTFFM